MSVIRSGTDTIYDPYFSTYSMSETKDPTVVVYMSINVVTRYSVPVFTHVPDSRRLPSQVGPSEGISP